VIAAIVAAIAALAFMAAEPPPTVLASGGDQHLWFVHRKDGRARLGHIASTMPANEMREGAVLPSGAPEAMTSWEERVYLLYPGHSAVLPRAHILSTTAQRNATTGVWFSVPSDRLELLPALPRTNEDDAARVDLSVESMAASADGPMLIYRGDQSLWRLHRGEWSSVALPPELASASRRRIEAMERGYALLADSGTAGAWERWRPDGDSWSRMALGIDGALDLRPIDGPRRVVLVIGDERRLAYLPDDGAIEFASVDPDEVIAWFSDAPIVLRHEPELSTIRLDPLSGDRQEAVVLRLQRPIVAAWFHLPIIGALAVALLMVVFFVKALRDPRTQSMAVPPAWSPAPVAVRLAALGVDLVPGVILAKLAWGVPWSMVLVPPAFVFEVESAVPSLTALLASVLLSGTSEAIFGRSIGKLMVRARVISLRAEGSTRPTLVQTLARNVFKAVILQMPVLGLFTLLDPTRRGVGEMVSGTAVVRRGIAPSTPPSGQA